MENIWTFIKVFEGIWTFFDKGTLGNRMVQALAVALGQGRTNKIWMQQMNAVFLLALGPKT